MTPAPEPFTVPEVCTLTGATKHQLRYWDISDLIHPSIQGTEGRPGKRRLYSWNDVEAVRDILEMLKTKTLQQIRAEVPRWQELRSEA